MPNDEESQNYSITTEENAVSSPFEDFVRSITKAVAPIVENELQSHLPQSSGECIVCKRSIRNVSNELNVFTGATFTRYYLCDECTQSILKH